MFRFANGVAITCLYTLAALILSREDAGFLFSQPLYWLLLTLPPFLLALLRQHRLAYRLLPLGPALALFTPITLENWAIWTVCLALLLLVFSRGVDWIARTPASSSAPAPNRNNGPYWATAAFLIVVAAAASIPLALPGSHFQDWSDYVGMLLLALQFSLLGYFCLPRKYRLLQEELEGSTDLSEKLLWWSGVIGIFAYVALFGEQGSYLGILDGTLLLAPLLVWAVLRFSAFTVALAASLVPSGVALFQFYGWGATPAPAIALGNSGVTTLSALLLLILSGLWTWRHMSLRGQEGIRHFERYVSAKASIGMLLMGASMAFLVIQNARWQADFVLSRFAKEATAIFANVERQLNFALDGTPMKCNAQTRSNLLELASPTAFVLSMGIENGAGELICSTSPGPQMGTGQHAVREGLSYVVRKGRDGRDQLLMVLGRPGGMVAYAILNIPSLVWSLERFSDGDHESVSLRIGNYSILSPAKPDDTHPLSHYEKAIHVPRYLLEARVFSGAPSLATALPPMLLAVFASCTALLFIVVMVGDLREKEQRQKIKVAADTKARSDFLLVMSHEIRTPLSGLLGNLELLTRHQHKGTGEQGSASDFSASLEDAFTSAKNLMRIINDELDLSKIASSGSLPLSLAPGRITDVIGAVVCVHASNAGKKGLHLHSLVDDALDGYYRLDAVRLQQVLGNLVSNAIKFTERGEILLKARRIGSDEGGSRVRFEVRDSGSGISKEVQSNLFKPFFQVPGKHTAKGSGLGLTISQHLVEKMGGSIKVDSQPGRGATFSFEIFFSEADPKEVAKVLHPLGGLRNIAAPRGQGKVLIVDDHAFILDLLARQLQELGFASCRAGSMDEALARYAEEAPFAAILTDENMPDGNGTALAAEIRRQERGSPRRTPIILCTADISLINIDTLDDFPVDEVLLKPHDLVRLRDIMERWGLPPSPGEGTAAGMAGMPAAGENGLEELLYVTRGDLGKAAELCGRLYHVNCADIEAIRALLADDDDRRKVKSHAHRITGASGLIGAQHLAALAATLEQSALSAATTECMAMLAAIEAENAKLPHLADSLNART